MSKKRGILLVVVLLVNLVFAFAESNVNTVKYDMAFMCVSDDDYGYGGKGIEWIPTGSSIPECNPEGDDPLKLYEDSWVDIRSIATSPPWNDYGCLIAGGETNENHNYFVARIYTGTYLPIGGVTNWPGYTVTTGIVGYSEFTDSEVEEDVFERNYNNYFDAKLCADDHYWHDCSLTEDGTIEGTLTWSTGYLYQCQNVEDIATWVKLGKDIDHDGYVEPAGGGVEVNPSVRIFDCKDYDTTTYGTDLDCPKSPDDCDAESAHCAICIHPEKPEICGDGADNDCNPATSDNCNEFKEGCEQTLVTTDEHETPLLDQFNNPLSLDHKNIDGNIYSWINTEEGGLCCGYDDGESNKLGLIKTDLHTSEEKICLPQKDVLDEEVLGYEGTEIPGWGAAAAECEGKDWCWLRASAAEFRIITFNGETTFDVVSNNEKWVKCDGTEGDNNIAQGGDTNLDGLDLEKANRFYCYNEGTRWSWAECLEKLI